MLHLLPIAEPPPATGDRAALIAAYNLVLLDARYRDDWTMTALVANRIRALSNP